MDIYESQFKSVLERILLTQIQDGKDKLVTHPFVKFEDHRMEVGRLRGLQDALEALKTAEVELTRRPEDNTNRGWASKYMESYES
jgi:hypothetical protein